MEADSDAEMWSDEEGAVAAGGLLGFVAEDPASDEAELSDDGAASSSSETETSHSSTCDSD